MNQFIKADQAMLKDYKNEMELTYYVGSTDAAYIFMSDSVEVGYVVYNHLNHRLEKFEIFKSYRGKGHSYDMMNVFIESRLKGIVITLAPNDKGLFSYYSKFGFKRYWRKSMRHLMKLKVK